MNITLRLRMLDDLYYNGSLGDYETMWESVAEQVAREYPGFTLAYSVQQTLNIALVLQSHLEGSSGRSERSLVRKQDL